jgi:hypothetical protein
LLAVQDQIVPDHDEVQLPTAPFAAFRLCGIALEILRGGVLPHDLVVGYRDLRIVAAHRTFILAERALEGLQASL